MIGIAAQSIIVINSRERRELVISNDECNDVRYNMSNDDKFDNE